MVTEAEWTERDLEALRRLIVKAEADPEFSDEDVAAIQTVVEAIKGLRLLGRFTKWLIFVLASIAAVITAWDKIWGKLKDIV